VESHKKYLGMSRTKRGLFDYVFEDIEIWL